MPVVKLLSYNVKGLNSPVKRHKILKELKTYRTDIAFLQETHLTIESNIRLFSQDFPTWYYGDTISKRARGVAIGIAKGTRFKLFDRLTDPEGRFLFLKGKIEEMVCTLVNIYAPNDRPLKYMVEVLGKLRDFRVGKVILGGDLNLCMDPRLDKTSQIQGSRNTQLRKFKNSLYRSQLIDVWRTLNPGHRDYTFYSPVHGSYSRIDYFFLDHSLLEMVVETRIEAITSSDHAPIGVSLKIAGNQKPNQTWRLNEGLLMEESSLARVKKGPRRILQDK